MGNKMVKKNIILLVIAAIIVILPILIITNSEFGGADGQAEEAITQIDDTYEAWFSPIWEPPGGEIESLLFALQAALGAGVICYCIGYLKGKSKAEKGNPAPDKSLS